MWLLCHWLSTNWLWYNWLSTVWLTNYWLSTNWLWYNGLSIMSHPNYWLSTNWMQYKWFQITDCNTTVCKPTGVHSWLSPNYIAHNWLRVTRCHLRDDRLIRQPIQSAQTSLGAVGIEHWCLTLVVDDTIYGLWVWLTITPPTSSTDFVWLILLSELWWGHAGSTQIPILPTLKLSLQLTRRGGRMSRASTSRAGRSWNLKITGLSLDPVDLIFGWIKPMTLKLILVAS